MCPLNINGELSSFSHTGELPLNLDSLLFPLRGTRISPTSFKVGDPIGDHLRVLGLVGVGAMGVVYLALDERDRELVAVKTIKDYLHPDEETWNRFREEALFWSQIGRHPYILDARAFEDISGQIYVIMDYIPPAKGMEGSSLRHWLGVPGALNEERILQWAIQFCHGMEHSYSHGIKCHRDIKPENILIDQNGNVRIADFGLAIPIKKETGGYFRGGSPHYMAPEQFSKPEQADALSDLYSFGVVLFEMVEGKRPFTVTQSQFLQQGGWKAWERVHSEDPVPHAREPFDEVTQRSLKKNRTQRFQSFKELRTELEKICKKQGYAVEKPVLLPPSHADLNLKGQQLFTLGHFKESMEYFDQVLTVEPQNLIALTGKGKCLLSLGSYKEAMECFGQVLVHNEREIPAHIGMGLCFEHLKRHDEANQYFEKALNINCRDPLAWYHKGRNLEERGRREEAISCYYRALDFLISLKRDREALDIAKEAMGAFPEDLRLKQLEAWSRRLGGLVERDFLPSLEVLKHLPDEIEPDPETAGILAGTYKRLWFADPVRHEDKLEKAYDLYFNAWQRSNKKNTYVGINAATLCLLLGRAGDSRAIAREVKELHDRHALSMLLAPGASFSGYWDRVTLAEAELLLGHLGNARRLYRNAMKLYAEKRSYIDSSTDQINLILPCLGLSVDAVEFLNSPTAVPRPRSVRYGITGHRKLPSPETLEEKSKKVLVKARQDLPKGTQAEIISPLAEGADRLAAKVFLAEPEDLLRVPLPLEINDYLNDFRDKDSKKEFKKYLNGAEELIFLPTSTNPADAYQSAGRYVVDHCDVLIALWDGKDGNGNGGTAEVVAYARAKGLPLIWINVEPPHRKISERLGKLKTMNYQKGESSMYEPKPIDTSNVQLPDDLLELTELLAENNHDHWAILRFKEGWKWGAKRNDKAKTNPDLIPYSDLPGSEKEFDRRNALETLKAIIALGYRIEKR